MIAPQNSTQAGTFMIAADSRSEPLFFRATRVLSLIVVPFLITAFYILYLRTGETR